MRSKATNDDRYDALLLLSFGGPEGPDDVLPFLRNVTRGRNVPDERLAVVAEQYAAFGGRSPINDQCRALMAALVEAGIDLPVYWGNRNWAPFLVDTVTSMADDGIENALVFVTSAFGSYSGCRQYRQDLEAAAVAVGDRAPTLTKLRLFYNHPGFLQPMADHLRAAAEECAEDVLAGRARIVFTAHSIPESMATGCDYESQLNEAAREIMEMADLGTVAHDLAFQSRSGPPSMPWLEPDINDHLTRLADDDTTSVILVPIGFISDHMEVLFDLDTQAMATAVKVGIELRRVPTVGTDPRFVEMIIQLIEERRSDRPRLFVGASGPWPDDCPPDHCPAATRPKA